MIFSILDPSKAEGNFVQLNSPRCCSSRCGLERSLVYSILECAFTSVSCKNKSIFLLMNTSVVNGVSLGRWALLSAGRCEAGLPERWATDWEEHSAPDKGSCSGLLLCLPPPQSLWARRAGHGSWPGLAKHPAELSPKSDPASKSPAVQLLCKGKHHHWSNEGMVGNFKACWRKSVCKWSKIDISLS